MLAFVHLYGRENLCLPVTSSASLADCLCPPLCVVAVNFWVSGPWNEGLAYRSVPQGFPVGAAALEGEYFLGQGQPFSTLAYVFLMCDERPEGRPQAGGEGQEEAMQRRAFPTPPSVSQASGH